MKLMDDNIITMYFDIFFQKEVAFIKLDNYRGTKKSSESSSSIHARFMCQWCRRCRRRLKCHRSSTKTRQTGASKCGTTSPEHLLDWIPYNMYIYIYTSYIYTHTYIYIYISLVAPWSIIIPWWDYIDVGNPIISNPYQLSCTSHI